LIGGLVHPGFRKLHPGCVGSPILSFLRSSVGMHTDDRMLLSSNDTNSMPTGKPEQSVLLLPPGEGWDEGIEMAELL